MKILHVINSVNPKDGGPIEGINSLAREMKTLGAHVDVLCSDSPDEKFINEDINFKIYKIGPSYTPYRFNPRMIPWLRDNLGLYDVIIVNGIWQYHGFAVRSALNGTSVPYFVFTHGMLDPWFKKTYFFKHLKKWIFWPWSEYRLLKNAAATLFTCEEEKLLARKSFWLYKTNEVVCNYGTAPAPTNKIELKNSFLKAHPEIIDKRVILFLSRIVEKKGCELLIRAFARIAINDNTIHLIMAGPDSEGLVANLKIEAQKLGVSSRISFVGMLYGDDKWGAFYSCEVFCLPSHQENFGIVVAEALACSIPVLISNKVNIWREIESYGAGFVDDDTEEGTFRNLERWLNARSYSNMKVQARLCFENCFHITKAGNNLLKILMEFIGDNPRK